MIFAGVAGADDVVFNLFSGRLDAVSIGSWGAGTIELDEDEAYLEGESLKIETTGFYEGGRLDLNEPIPAASLLADPDGGYLRIVVKTHEPVPERPERPEFPHEMDPEMYPEDFPMDPDMDPRHRRPREGPPMDPYMDEMPPEYMEDEYYMDMPGMYEPGIAAPPAPPREIEQLRVVLITEEGAVDSGSIQILMYPEVVDDWKQIVIPMSAFRGPVDISDSEIVQIALFGDTDEKFYLGELALGYEEQPLIADAGENLTVQAGEEVTFEAAPQPENVSASYTWDFDHLDGIQEEGYGRETTWAFETPGHYLVTLTVSDPDGRKVDRTDQIHVMVVE